MRHPNVLWVLGAAVLAGAGCRRDRGGRSTTGPVTVSHATVPVPTAAAEATAFLLVENTGADAQTLVTVSSPDAASVAVHQTTGGLMEPQPVLAIAGHARQRFAPGGLHLMLTGLTRQLTANDTVTLRLEFAPAGVLVVRAPVMRYTEAISEVP